MDVFNQLSIFLTFRFQSSIAVRVSQGEHRTIVGVVNRRTAKIYAGWDRRDRWWNINPD
jgi:hypothetical protein